MNLSEILRAKCDKEIANCSNEEIYFALLEVVQELSEKKLIKIKIRRNYTTYQQNF